MSLVASCGACALLLPLLAISCDPAQPTPDAAYGERFELTVGASRRVGPDGLVLSFDGVPSDSRCPENVTCVWEGDALVRLRLSLPRAAERTLELHTSGSAGSVEQTVERFKLRLVGLRPKPLAGEPVRADAYVATLVVSAAER